MAYEVTMPKLSDSMESGTVVEWKKSVGDKVDEGEVLAEIESDKATMELENYRSGYLVDIRKQNGEEADVGEVIAMIGKEPPAEGGKEKEEEEEEKKEEEEEEKGKEGEEEEGEKEEKPAQGEAKKESKPSETPPEEMEGYPGAEKGEEKKKEEKEKEEKTKEEKPGFKVPPAERGRIVVSPYAKHLAMLRGVDLGEIAGSGPGGRITAEDVEGARADRGPSESAEEPVGEKKGKAEPSGAEIEKSQKAGKIDVPDSLPEIKPGEEQADVERPSNYYLSMVAHVTAAKHHIPHFYVEGAADVGALMKAKANIPKDKHITVGHLVTKAVVDAIKAVPEINRSYDRERLIKWKHINIGLAVATEKGLASVAVHDADTMDYAELARATDDVVERARSGKLKPEDRKGATFTVSNLGMYNITSFSAIIDPPASSILAVARAQDAPIVRDGSLTFSKMLRLVLSCDHRAIDGVTAARFMDALVEILEDPGRMGLE